MPRRGRGLLAALVVACAPHAWAEPPVATTPRAAPMAPAAGVAPTPPPAAAPPPNAAPPPPATGGAIRLGRPYPAPVQPPNPGPPPDVYISIVPAQPNRFSDRARGRGGMGAAGHAGGGGELERDD